MEWLTAQTLWWLAIGTWFLGLAVAAVLERRSVAHLARHWRIKALLITILASLIGGGFGMLAGHAIAAFGLNVFADLKALQAECASWPIAVTLAASLFLSFLFSLIVTGILLSRFGKKVKE